MKDSKFVKVIEDAPAPKDDPSKKQVAAVKKALKGLTKIKKKLRADLSDAKRDREKKMLKNALKVNKLHRQKAMKFLKKAKG